jgi:hypothetical protein
MVTRYRASRIGGPDTPNNTGERHGEFEDQKDRSGIREL